jgi:hypothetical protein
MGLAGGDYLNLNTISKNHMLKNKINIYSPSIVLLQETNCDDITMTTIAKKYWIGFKSIATITIGCDGGLEILGYLT